MSYEDSIKKLDEAAQLTKQTSRAYNAVLTSEGEQDITLSDGTKTPNLNKRLKSAIVVQSVNGKTGNVEITRSDLGIPSNTEIAEMQKQDNKIILESGRTQREKNKEIVSVQDFGAKGDGVTNDTNAFSTLEAQYQDRTIDLFGKTYLVDSDFSRNNYVNGFLLINGIYKIKGEHPLKSDHIYSDLAYEVTGLTNRFLQGSCRHGDMLFLAQAYDSNGTDGADRSILLQYDLSSGTPTLVAQTSPLSIGHGQDLGVKFTDDGYVLYSGTAPLGAGRLTYGICRIQWKGASTSESDLTFIDLASKLPNPLGKTFGSLNGGTTEDGSLYIALLFVAGSTQQDVYVVKTDDLDNFSSLSVINPVSAFPLPKLATPSDNNALQGIGGDSSFIALSYGAFRPSSQSCVQLLNYRGEVVGEYDVNSFKAEYQNRNLNNNTSNTDEYLYYAEQESVHFYKGEMYLPFMITFRSGGDVVTRRGKNYICVANTSSADPLAVNTNWVVTNMPATKGEWVSGTAYTSGSTTRHIKNFYRISSKKRPTSTSVSTMVSGRSTASLHIPSGTHDISYPSGEGFVLARYNESSYSLTNVLSINTGGITSIFDTSTASSTDYSAQIQTACLPDTSRYYAKFFFSESGVPQIQMYGKSDLGSNAGNLVIWAGSRQSYKVIGETGVNEFGTHVIAPSIDVGGVSFMTGSGSPEGAKDAVIGSMYIDTVTGDWYQKKSALGTKTGWVLK